MNALTMIAEHVTIRAALERPDSRQVTLALENARICSKEARLLRTYFERENSIHTFFSVNTGEEV